MSASIIGSKNRRRSRSRGRGGNKNDFFVTLSDASGVNRTMMIWVPLAVLARNVVLENGGGDNGCRVGFSLHYSYPRWLQSIAVAHEASPRGRRVKES